MKERPILFSSLMVCAILEGRKTQTRRVVKPSPGSDINPIELSDSGVWQWSSIDSRRRCPYGRPGDLLWVRETWDVFALSGEVPSIAYAADSTAIPLVRHYQEGQKFQRPDNSHRWRPSIHMPRWASRLTLRITDVRVQRLQEISGRDAVREGTEKVWLKEGECDPAAMPAWSVNRTVDAFARLWDSINGKRSPWDSNPWVWAISFERI